MDPDFGPRESNSHETNQIPDRDSPDALNDARYHTPGAAKTSNSCEAATTAHGGAGASANFRHARPG